jgi:hypothetical protein
MSVCQQEGGRAVILAFALMPLGLLFIAFLRFESRA